MKSAKSKTFSSSPILSSVRTYLSVRTRTASISTCFFPDAVPVKDLEEKFLHEIDFLYQGEPQSEDKKRKLKEANLTELGDRLKKEQPSFTQSPLYVGMLNAVVDHKQVSKILFDKSAIFGGKYLFLVMADEDLSSISWTSRDHLTRKTLIQKSDMLFSSNAKTRQWALGTHGKGECPAGFLVLLEFFSRADKREAPAFIGERFADGSAIRR